MTVTVVTGAGGAMGSACAEALAHTTDAMLLTDVDPRRLSSTATHLEQNTSAKVIAIPGDLADDHFITSLVSETTALGRLRALVHTAGLSPAMAPWHQILRVDLVATARLLGDFLSHVTAGSVAVCLASVSAHMGDFDPAIAAVLDDPLDAEFDARFTAVVGDDPDPGATYRLAKFGVVRLCARAAVAWGERGGRIVSVSPGLIDTDMGRLELQHQPIKTWLAEITPVKRDRAPLSPLPGTADDIANAVAFLCSDQASFISGCDIRVDGGLIPAINQHSPTEHQ